MANWVLSNHDYPTFEFDALWPHTGDGPKKTQREVAEFTNRMLYTTEFKFREHKIKNRVAWLSYTFTSVNAPTFESETYTQEDFKEMLNAHYIDLGVRDYAFLLMLDYIFVDFIRDISNKNAVWKYKCSNTDEREKIQIYPYTTQRVSGDVNYVVNRLQINSTINLKMGIGAFVASIQQWPTATKGQPIYFITRCVVYWHGFGHAAILVVGIFPGGWKNIYILDSNISHAYRNGHVILDGDRYLDIYSNIIASLREFDYFSDITTRITLITNGWQKPSHAQFEYLRSSCGLLSCLLLSRFIRNTYIDDTRSADPRSPRQDAMSEFPTIDDIKVMRRLVSSEFERLSSQRNAILVVPTYAERQLHEMLDMHGKRIFPYNLNEFILPESMFVCNFTLNNQLYNVVQYIPSDYRSTVRHYDTLEATLLLETLRDTPQEAIKEKDEKPTST